MCRKAPARHAGRAQQLRQEAADCRGRQRRMRERAGLGPARALQACYQSLLRWHGANTALSAFSSTSTVHWWGRRVRYGLVVLGAFALNHIHAMPLHGRKKVLHTRRSWEPVWRALLCDPFRIMARGPVRLCHPAHLERYQVGVQQLLSAPGALLESIKTATQGRMHAAGPATSCTWCTCCPRCRSRRCSARRRWTFCRSRTPSRTSSC